MLRWVVLLSLGILATVSAAAADYQVTLFDDFRVSMILGNQGATIESSPFADWDADGRTEVIGYKADWGYTLQVRDLATGALEFEHTFTDGIFNIADCWVRGMDVNNDRYPEAIIGLGSSRGTIVVLTFAGGTASIMSEPAPIPPPNTALYPNPFNPSATIDYNVPSKGKVALDVYDTAGRLVRSLVDGVVDPGAQSVVWDGRDNTGRQLPSGTYFYRLALNGAEIESGKAVIVK